MPLRARVDGQEVLSIDLSPTAFDALRGRRDLTMACCEARAVPKRSVTGLPFFAHGRTSGCDSAAETEFHLRGKVLIRDAARVAGWTAQVEVPGTTPGGARWRADVLCEEGGRQVAFELQRSGITLAHLGERQARYWESGVRGMWFMRTHERRLKEPQVWQHQTPALYITEGHHVPAFQLGLSEVVQAALSGQLLLFPAPRWPVRVTTMAHTYRCHYCRSVTAVLARVFLAPIGRPEVLIEAPWTVEGLAGWVNEVIGRAGAVSFPLVPRKVHKSYSGSVYDCVHCEKWLFVHSRPKDHLDRWRRLATQDDPVEQHPTWMDGGSLAVRSIVTLTPSEHQWFRERVGGGWVLRRWLRGADEPEDQRG